MEIAGLFCYLESFGYTILLRHPCHVLPLLAVLAGAALRVVQPQLLRGASPSDLAVLLISLAAFGYRPSRSWLRDHGAALRRQLQHLGVRRIANLLWAHAKLGLRPMDDLLLADMVQVLHGSLHETNTRDLANSLWALATLGYMPPRGFLSAFGEQVRQTCSVGGVGLGGMGAHADGCALQFGTGVLMGESNQPGRAALVTTALEARSYDIWTDSCLLLLFLLYHSG